MRKIENFAQISDLLNAQLKRGVLTNNFLRGEDYTREIANGLYIHEADGALLLFRERGDHLVMTFYLHPGAVLSLPKTDRPVVTELSCRAKDADAMANAAEQFCARFSEGAAPHAAHRKPKHFRWKQPHQFLQSRRISRIFPAFKRALLRSHWLSADCGRSAKNLANGQTVITGTKKVFPVCCILRFPAPRPRFGTLPCV